MAAAEPNWDAVYAEQLPRVYNFFRYRLGNDAVAEDLTSRTFEKAWAARVADIGAISRASRPGCSASRATSRSIICARSGRICRSRRRRKSPRTRTPHDEVARDSDLARLGALMQGLPQREQELSR